MSQENAEAVRGVRIPLAGAKRGGPRTLDERIIVRFPALARQLSAAWARLPRHSRLRRVILTRFLVTVEMSGHGAGSGVSISQHLFQLFTVGRGLVVRQIDYLDRAEVLEVMEPSE
jgi:hypothetical protein